MRGVVGAIITAAALAGCSNPSPATEASPANVTTVTITSADLPGIDVVSAPVDPDAPERIVSLATGVGETLVALGMADRVVGRDETSDTAELRDVPIVTQAHSVSAEKVISLDPDLVIVDARTTPTEALDQIEASGITIVEVPEAWTLADIAPRIDAVATAVGVDPRDLIERIPIDAPPSTEAPKVAFLYLRGTSGIYLLGGSGSGADSLITAAGGIDVGAQAGYDPFIPLTAEALASLNPDVILVMTKGLDSVNGIDGLVALPGVAQTRAGKDERVIVVDDAVLLSFGPRTPALVDRLREALAQVAP